MEKSPFIWMNGEFKAWDDAQIHVLTHGLHYGFGFFEGIRAYQTSKDNSAIFRLDEHIKRLFNSLKIGGMEVAFTPEQISQACKKLLELNQISSAYIRPIIFFGTGNLGVHPGDNPVHAVIAAWKWGSYLGKDALEKGIRAKVSSYTRYHPNSAMTHTKMTGSYMLSAMAKMEVKKLGYDEAILLDKDGYVAEGSAENIFILCNGHLITPPRMAILPGITRDSIMILAREFGYTVIEQRFSRDQLYTADEAFFTGTAAEVTPISSVDDRVIGQGTPGPITKKLQEIYFKTVKGENENYQHWLTYYKVSQHPESIKSSTMI